MYHFFVTKDQVLPGEILVLGPDVNHMKNALRMKPGEQLKISDGDNRSYLCEVSGFEGECAHLAILEEIPNDTELGNKLVLFQGLPKGDKMELIVQKAVELGAARIVPVEMRRCVVKLDAKKAPKKVERWNGIALSAAKQAGRSAVPEVTGVVTFAEALQMAKELDVNLIPYELAEGIDEARAKIRAIKPGQSVGIFIGPEGGFDREEVEKAMEIASPITLGKRILRTETAGMAVLAVLMFELEQ